MLKLTMISRLVRDEGGEVAVSYLLIAALVTMAALTGIDAAGHAFQGLLATVADAIHHGGMIRH
jgi:Flp pilus assembly pilin Flp